MTAPNASQCNAMQCNAVQCNNRSMRAALKWFCFRVIAIAVACVTQEAIRNGFGSHCKLQVASNNCCRCRCCCCCCCFWTTLNLSALFATSSQQHDIVAQHKNMSRNIDRLIGQRANCNSKCPHQLPLARPNQDCVFQ